MFFSYSIGLFLFICPFLTILTQSMAPPLPPKPLGTYLTGNPSVPPTIEVEWYCDLVCPFSAKTFLTLFEKVVPAIQADETKTNKISIKMHHVVQPWHPAGTLVHEAALAVKKAAQEELGEKDGTDQYLTYVENLCKLFTGDQKKYSDADTWNKSRPQIYEELIADFNEPDGGSVSAAAMKLLVPENLVGNCGNGVTQDIKWACKHHRAMGVHVTPTVFVNGIEAVQISSGWTCEDWMEFFDSF
jgi:protein-disulfide isomerase